MQLIIEGKWQKSKGAFAESRKDEKNETHFYHGNITKYLFPFVFLWTAVALGSDGLLHDWYQVYLGNGVESWARSDLVAEGWQHG